IEGSGGNWFWNPTTEKVEETANAYQYPQCSACFIQSVTDDLRSIFELVKNEAMLFKYGSGTGTNFSNLRSKGEELSGGGKSSGVMSFLKVLDAGAGSIKSGGTTRRAAKMVVLDMDHPEIVDFIDWKVKEEEKARLLIAHGGYPADFNGEAYQTVSGQNSNNSVRIPDEFMKAYLDNTEWATRWRTDHGVAQTYQAKELMDRIAQAAWRSADPGVQFDTTIQEWNPVANSDRINATNPCVTADTLVATPFGYRRIIDLVGQRKAILGGDNKLHYATAVFKTGRKAVFELRTHSGYTLKLTADHPVYTLNRGDVPASELNKDDILALSQPSFGTAKLEQGVAEAIGMAVGDGMVYHLEHANRVQTGVIFTVGHEEQPILARAKKALYNLQNQAYTDGETDRRSVRTANAVHTKTGWRFSISAKPVVELLTRYAILDQKSQNKQFTDQVFELDRRSIAAIMRGLFTTDGTVANYGEKSQYIALDSTSLKLLRQVQILMLGFGIKSKIYENRRTELTQILPNGRGGSQNYQVKQYHSLRVSRASRRLFEQTINFMEGSEKQKKLQSMNNSISTYREELSDSFESLTPLGTEDVYDLTEPETSHFIANGIVVHNCAEFIFIDDTACNLASFNLMQFTNPDGSIKVDEFRHAVRILITAMEILVDFASYPTKQIAERSHQFRPLGLGYANLGTLLMINGIPYDSPEGRAWAGAITAILHCDAYATSAELASQVGPFEAYQANREPFQAVVRKHAEAAYKLDATAAPKPLIAAAHQAADQMVALGEQHGFRNAQVTNIAPTGTIALLMDCDTTGVEPDFALVKYKKLAGGGFFKIINQSVPRALRTLGYNAREIDDINRYIVGSQTLDGVPHINRETLKAKGLTDEEVDNVNRVLPSVFDFSSAFGEWTLGQACLTRLGIKGTNVLLELGFTAEQIEQAGTFVCGMMTIEGAPHVKPAHLPVFDCANKNGRHGVRYIEAMGHVRMMAAVQPFISGAISKTVNLPEDATVEDITQVYLESWKLGLKALSVYRDNSKMSQPLSTVSEARKERDNKSDSETQPRRSEETSDVGVPTAASGFRPQRRRMPDERKSITHKFTIAGHDGYLTIGLFEDGSPGEIFIRMAKEGSTIAGLMDSFAIAVSMGLQYGVPLDTIVSKFAHVRFDPSGFTTHPKIRIAKSLIDYIARYLAYKFLPKERWHEVGLNGETDAEPTQNNGKTSKPVDQPTIFETKTAKPDVQPVNTPGGSESVTQTKLDPIGDSPTCSECGGMMTRSGTCYKCMNCGSTSGCS
ncbi:vitamin B12-dependent ribonucleotide reductase, partial [Candidatus Berkelbacteria bacterium]|nr:vitamin B12-dependent ribonucleotide reductase [Candidatus Berkelbacteria bacterium]